MRIQITAPAIPTLADGAGVLTLVRRLVKHKKRVAALLAVSQGCTTAGGVQMGEHWRSETIAWQDAGADGTRYALLSGNRTSAETFSYAFFIPAGFWDPAHWHTQTAHVFVASGTLKLGYGDTHDAAQLIAYPAGSFVVVPAGARHFDGADEDTIIFGVAQGPWATSYVDPHHVPSAGTPDFS